MELPVFRDATVMPGIVYLMPNGSYRWSPREYDSKPPGYYVHVSDTRSDDEIRATIRIIPAS